MITKHQLALHLIRESTIIPNPLDTALPVYRSTPHLLQQYNTARYAPAGYVVSDSDLNRLFKELDTDGTGLVRYHEFVAGAIDSNILVGDSLLRWIFDFMDDDDSDTITGDNLRVRLPHSLLLFCACVLLLCTLFCVQWQPACAAPALSLFCACALLLCTL